MANYLSATFRVAMKNSSACLPKSILIPHGINSGLVGDLVARGPGSLDVLRFFAANEGTAHTVLGNHDLHLLAVYGGLKRAKPVTNLTPYWRPTMPPI